MPPLRVPVALAAAFAVLAGTAAVGLPAAADGWTLEGTHPQAVHQDTSAGRRLQALEVWGGRIYSGYGDYGANTGPIAVTPFDPVADTWTRVHTSDTESIQIYRAIGGKLYAPAVDPISDADYAVGEPWRDVRPVGSIHAFDMAATADGLWLVGSKGRNAVVWRSTDGGQTWGQSLAVPPIRSDDYARFYFAGAYSGRVYVQAVDLYYNRGHATSYVWDGS